MTLRTTQYLFVLSILLGNRAIAQFNLVPNGGFENIIQCPSNCVGATTSTLAVGWVNPNNGSSDLFSSCDNTICSGWNQACNSVPANCWGWQNARTGTNYCGLAVYATTQSNAREYVEIKLSDSLRQNRTYCVSYYASLADSFSGYSISSLGAYLSKNLVANFSQFLINVNPQIQNPTGNFISNQLWYNISGLYSATGGEDYITLGNFFDDNNTDTSRVQIASTWRPGAYYFIDDVSIVDYVPASVRPDTTVCRGSQVRGSGQYSFGAQYSWNVIAGDLSSIDSNSIANPLLTPSINTTYVLQKTQCGVVSYDTLFVRIPGVFPAQLPNDTSICAGDTILLNAVNNCSWCNHIWNTGSGAVQILVSPSSTTNFSFSQTDSCFTSTDNLNVNLTYCDYPNVNSPNVFTPNGDGINDAWLPQIINELAIDNYTLNIYDRWGILVFQTNKSKNGWDGHDTAGIACVEGTYYYIIEYSDLKSIEQKRIKGFLQLLR